MATAMEFGKLVAQTPRGYDGRALALFWECHITFGLPNELPADWDMDSATGLPSLTNFNYSFYLVYTLTTMRGLGSLPESSAVHRLSRERATQYHRFSKLRSRCRLRANSRINLSNAIKQSLRPVISTCWPPDPT